MTKFLEELTDFIFLEDQLKKSDVIFVPGSEEGVLAIEASKIYLEGFAPLLVPSGKYAKWTGHTHYDQFETESDYFAHLMLENGVSEEAILCEREATYTYENALFTKKLLDKKGLFIQKAILCCQAYHARRCKLYYQAVFPETEILVHPVVTKNITKDNWFQKEEGIKIVLGEIERCGSQFHEIVKKYGKNQGGNL